ncbi:UDP-N-acetyl-D-mannosaminuronate dehydrogenase [Bradyrhizobium japonicum]
MEKLQDLGAKVAYSDPHVAVFPRLRHHTYFDLSSVSLTPDTIASFDCIVLATDHDRFDYAMIRDHASIIVDTRGKYLDAADNIVKS